MGGTISSFFYSENPSENENEKKNVYNQIFNSLNKISDSLDETESIIKEIEHAISNTEIDFMEWDYYDTPILETKILSAFENK